MLVSLASLAAVASSASVVSATTYPLVKMYSGSSFFDDWTYYGHYDNLTSGDVIFVNASVATSSSNPLTYINSAGNAILKVDNTTTVPYNEKRNSVRLASKTAFGVGSVWVLDALHTPYGCSTWPAFWSEGTGTWPTTGEIDTFEGVNLQSGARYAFHTSTHGSSSCQLSSTASMSGTINGTDCLYTANDNGGCAVADSDPASYGEDFAKAGGGVYITEFAESGINIWFFQRANIPTAITSANETIDLSSLGTPAATLGDSSCDIDTYFGAQRLIFDITLCGTWAGAAATLEATCPALNGTATCYSTYVMGNGSNYANAYFEVKSLKVYGVVAGSSSSASSGTSTVESAAGPVVRRSPLKWITASAVGGLVLLLSLLK